MHLKHIDDLPDVLTTHIKESLNRHVIDKIVLSLCNNLDSLQDLLIRWSKNLSLLYI